MNFGVAAQPTNDGADDSRITGQSLGQGLWQFLHRFVGFGDLLNRSGDFGGIARVTFLWVYQTHCQSIRWRVGSRSAFLAQSFGQTLQGSDGTALANGISNCTVLQGRFLPTGKQFLAKLLEPLLGIIGSFQSPKRCFVQAAQFITPILG